MIRAGIDIGTNTILLLVADVAEGSLRVLEDHVRVVRLGQGVDKNRAFHPDAMQRARACFAEYAEVLKKYPGIKVRAVATSGSRDAKNSADFFSQMKAEYGISIEVISGEEEALLSFKGALPQGAMDPNSIAVLDIGGGSAEIVGLKEQGDLFRYSFDMGCVRLTERFLHSNPPTEKEKNDLLVYVRAELEKQSSLLQKISEKTLVGVAGTATYLASSALGLHKFDVEKVHGYHLTLQKIESLIESFSKKSSAERLGIGGMDKGRADVILGGALLLREIMLKANKQELLTSVRGLRFGAVLD